MPTVKASAEWRVLGKEVSWSYSHHQPLHSLKMFFNCNLAFLSGSFILIPGEKTLVIFKDLPNYPEALSFLLAETDR